LYRALEKIDFSEGGNAKKLHPYEVSAIANLISVTSDVDEASECHQTSYSCDSRMHTVVVLHAFSTPLRFSPFTLLTFLTYCLAGGLVFCVGATASLIPSLRRTDELGDRFTDDQIEEILDVVKPFLVDHTSGGGMYDEDAYPMEEGE